MDRRDKNIRTAFGILLALATLATRWPIRARTLFEFDSINFAGAAFRFDLSEVTPQMPGYIFHVLLGRTLFRIIGDVNQAYVWLSILLSIGSVLFLWRAAAQLRGERAAVVAALLWLTTPLFWFQGAVGAIYTEEAFYASLLLYLGLKWMNNPSFWRGRSPYWQSGSASIVILYFAAFSLAGAARQTSLIFFLPATIFLLWKRRPSKVILRAGLVSFFVVTALWSAELLRESGGLQNYLYYLETENNFKTQSLLFGNSLADQLDTIGKAAFFLPLSLGAGAVAIIAAALSFPKRAAQFIREQSRTLNTQFVILIALPALLFYFIVFFMKAGYYLNVIPSAMLLIAVLTDRLAIWLAEREKINSPNKLKLTRPIITRYVVILSAALIAINAAWFFIRSPGTSQTLYDNEDTRNSFIHGAVNRYESSGERMLTLANRAFEYTNISGVRAVDSLNDATYRALVAAGANSPGQVIIASWWYRWCYFLLPQSVTYDIELDQKNPGNLWVGRSYERVRESIYDTSANARSAVIRIQSKRPVLLLLRHDRPDFQTVSSQVHLERLQMPEYLDIYRILDSAFVLKWGDRTFVKSY